MTSKMIINAMEHLNPGPEFAFNDNAPCGVFEEAEVSSNDPPKVSKVACYSLRRFGIRNKRSSIPISYRGYFSIIKPLKSSKAYPIYQR